MQIFDTPIAGLKIIQLNIFHDERGFFTERFNQDLFSKFNLPINYFQDNHSYSKKNVVRGLHFQNNPSQAKLVNCISGKILDVAVDIRKNSPTFGKYFAIELSAKNGKLLFIPEGFAHGFSVLDDNGADVLYKVDNKYSPQNESGIIFNDKDLKIDWQVANPIVSAKDQKLLSFHEYSLNPNF
jgi:dTDP-4-dehydrorhamnose 3,5-epimerase